MILRGSALSTLCSSVSNLCPCQDHRSVIPAPGGTGGGGIYPGGPDIVTQIQLSNDCLLQLDLCITYSTETQSCEWDDEMTLHRAWAAGVKCRDWSWRGPRCWDNAQFVMETQHGDMICKVTRESESGVSKIIASLTTNMNIWLWVFALMGELWYGPHSINQMLRILGWYKIFQ